MVQVQMRLSYGGLSIDGYFRFLRSSSTVYAPNACLYIESMALIVANDRLAINDNSVLFRRTSITSTIPRGRAIIEEEKEGRSLEFPPALGNAEWGEGIAQCQGFRFTECISFPLKPSMHRFRRHFYCPLPK